MKKFPSSKYPITPITDEATYMRFCEWAETLDDLDFKDEIEEQKKFAHIDALTTLIEAYENKHFRFNKIELTVTQIIEQALEQLNLNRKDKININHYPPQYKIPFFKKTMNHCLKKKHLTYLCAQFEHHLLITN